MAQIFDYEMEKDFIALPEDTTAKEAIKILRESTGEDAIFYAYVVNEFKILKGVLPLRKLLVAQPDRLIKDLMKTSLTVVNAQMTQEEVNELFRRTKFLAIPVVDDASRIMGTVTLKKAVDDMTVENADEVLKIQGAGINVFDSSFLTRLKVKLPWLITTVISGLICGFIMAFFEKSVLSNAVALSFFIPLITAMGESVGGQSSAIVIEGLILGKVDEKKAMQIMARQFIEGIAMGAVIAAAVGLVVSFWLKNTMIAVLTGGTIFITILIATLNGTIIPLILKKLNINPVASTNPLVFAITDIMVLLIYFSSAIILLRHFAA
jgi:magnesium transporter